MISPAPSSSASLLTRGPRSLSSSNDASSGSSSSSVGGKGASPSQPYYGSEASVVVSPGSPVQYPAFLGTGTLVHPRSPLLSCSKRMSTYGAHYSAGIVCIYNANLNGPSYRGQCTSAQ
ncbi:hypothetical protein BS47DRAFT_80989 [Hydnum rufescens UP504]|uniref:Uncharacterized protein n=1 Tax=Hydnum rufescens UP504 TaxID=1448309 RepID=A0A9P6BAG4_9AGAM|nr:hypothetical protein BS47DRAFT_80989 [Hydnum rufescens UP504]